MWERNISCLPLAHPWPGTWPATQACALTGNQTSNLSVHRPMLNPLNHSSQGSVGTVLKKNIFLTFFLFSKNFLNTTVFLIYTRYFSTLVVLNVKYLLNAYYVLGTALSCWGFNNEQKNQEFQRCKWRLHVSMRDDKQIKDILKYVLCT